MTVPTLPLGTGVDDGRVVTTVRGHRFAPEYRYRIAVRYTVPAARFDLEVRSRDSEAYALCPCGWYLVFATGDTLAAVEDAAEQHSLDCRQTLSVADERSMK